MTESAIVQSGDDNLPSQEMFNLNELIENSKEFKIIKSDKSNVLKIHVTNKDVYRKSMIAEKTEDGKILLMMDIKDKSRGSIKSLQEKGLTQQEIADCTGYSQSMISNIIRNNDSKIS